MDFPKISGNVQKKFFSFDLLFARHFWCLYSNDVYSQRKISLTLSWSRLSTENGLEKLILIKMSKFYLNWSKLSCGWEDQKLGRSQHFFPTFSEENKILASFPLVKLKSRRCWLDRDSAAFLFHIWSHDFHWTIEVDIAVLRISDYLNTRWDFETIHRVEP